MPDHAEYIYGRHPVTEALQRSPKGVRRLFVANADRGERLTAILRLASQHRIQVVEVSKRTLSDLVGDAPHQGVVALVHPFAYVDIDEMLARAEARDEAPLLVALDQIQDPQNLGAIARSALALGAHGLIIPKDRACGVTPAAVKASAGATAELPIARITNLRRTMDELKQQSLWTIGTAIDGPTPLWQVDFIQPTLLVIGSEGRGLRPLVQKGCDIVANIPMANNLASINASVAAGVCLYEALRQRRTS